MDHVLSRAGPAESPGSGDDQSPAWRPAWVCPIARLQVVRPVTKIKRLASMVVIGEHHNPPFMPIADSAADRRKETQTQGDWYV
jgi:hypothetical protein